MRAYDLSHKLQTMGGGDCDKAYNVYLSGTPEIVDNIPGTLDELYNLINPADYDYDPITNVKFF